jgi:hypothetical protein
MTVWGKSRYCFSANRAARHSVRLPVCVNLG